MSSVYLKSWMQDPMYPHGNLVDIIAEYARVSNPGQPSRSNDRLIKYLLEHNHWSPFEMVNIVLDIRTTRDISRQILRHHSFRFQEFSQRYSATETVGDPKECRLQDWQNRQSSLPCDNQSITDQWDYAQAKVRELAFTEYDNMLKLGVAKEVSRALLPEGLTETRLFVNGTVRSWIHYIKLRTGIETQKEHRDVAFKCAKAIKPVFPMIEEFTNDY